MKYIVSTGGDDHEVTVDGADVTLGDARMEARLTSIEGSPVRLLTIGDRVHRVVVRRGAERGRYTLWVDGHRFDVDALDERTRTIRELSRASAPPAGPAPVAAPMPGLIVRVSVEVGDTVAAGQGIVVMEAMKMENELRAVAAGTVKAVHVAPGAAVEKGMILVELE